MEIGYFVGFHFLYIGKHSVVNVACVCGACQFMLKYERIRGRLSVYSSAMVGHVPGAAGLVVSIRGLLLRKEIIAMQ